MNKKPDTPFLETEALLAVLNENFDRLRELLGEFSVGELETFGNQLIELNYQVVKTKTDRMGGYLQSIKENLL